MADDKSQRSPDPASIARATHKKALDEKLRKALDNPELDAAIERVKPKLRPGEDPLYFDVNRVSLTSVTPPAGAAAAPAGEQGAAAPGSDGQAQPAAPATGDEEATLQRSPWARNGAGAPLDADALPSSHVPPAVPPTSVPIARRPRPRRRALALLEDLPPWQKSALALLAVFAPLTIVLLATRTPRVDEPRGARSAQPAAMPAPSAAPGPPPASAAAPPAALSASAGAAAPPVSAATSAAAPPLAPPPRHLPSRYKDGQGDDPYDAAPTAPPTAAPTAPPSAAPTAAPAPQPPAPSPSSSSPKVTPIF
jgi:hypothetical protein